VAENDRRERHPESHRSEEPAGPDLRERNSDARPEKEEVDAAQVAITVRDGSYVHGSSDEITKTLGPQAIS